MKIKQLSTKAEIIRTILSKAEEPIYLAFILLSSKFLGLLI